MARVMSEALRWITCAPRDYPGDEQFFSRDTGLLCRGLRELGLECQAVLCGQARADDHPDLIRASFAELESPAWWSARKVDAVVLHTWSRKEYTGILKAIRAAGARIVLLQDGSGICGPLGPWWAWVRETWYLRRRHGWAGLAWFTALMLYGHTLRFFRFERDRAEQFALADFVVAPSPGATAGYRMLFSRYGLADAESKVRLLPHPAAAWFTWKEGAAKDKRIVAVGRWKDFWQKRPDLLGAALAEILGRHPEWSAEIFGDTGPLEDWHQQLPAPLQSRIHLAGRVPNSRLIEAMAQAKILLCSSAYESFHIASAEALCSGASIAGFDSPSLPSLRWFATEHSGSLSPRFGAAGLVEACESEIAEWEAGRRDPAAISRAWQPRLHAAAVARTLQAMTRA